MESRIGSPYTIQRRQKLLQLSEGGSTDRVLPILVRRVPRNEEQGRTAINRIMEVDAKAGVSTVCIRRLEDAHGRSMRDNEALQQELAETRAEVIELRTCQKVYKNDTFFTWSVSW